MTKPHDPRRQKVPASRLRRALRYRGLLVLVLWQAPVQPVVRPNGSLGLVVLGGSDVHETISCEGSVVESQKVSYGGAAVEADYDLGRVGRVAGVVGYSNSDWGSHRGAFGGTQFRADWGGFGIGAGLAVLPGWDEYDGDPEVLPSGYLRVGSDDGFHGRLDFLPPNALGMQQIGRLGLGWNAVRRDLPQVFVGYAGVGSASGADGVALDLTIPTTSRFALRAQGHWGSAQSSHVTGIAFGGSWLLGGGH